MDTLRCTVVAPEGLEPSFAPELSAGAPWDPQAGPPPDYNTRANALVNPFSCPIRIPPAVDADFDES